MSADHNYYVYILTNWNNRVMYIGVTNNLERRLFEHKNKLVKGFTEKYNTDKLVYFESTTDVRSAIEREKEIKKWRREKKNNLVETANPEWKDLSVEWSQKPRIPSGDSVPHEVVELMIDHDYTIIRAWREYLGLTQKEVADKIGITQAAYSQMESARRLKKITKTRIANALGINPEQV